MIHKHIILVEWIAVFLFCSVHIAKSQVIPTPTNQQIPTSPTAIHEDELDEMWRFLKSIDTMSSRFSEEKFIALMSKPLPAEGRYYYRKPDYLVRIVDAPYREVITMQSDRLTIDHKDMQKTETIDLNQQPLARAIIQHLLWLFGGEKERIHEHYFTNSQGVEGNNYLLELSPRKAPLNQIIDKLQIWVDKSKSAFKVQIVEMGGDLTILNLGEIVINQPLPSIIE